MGELIRIEHGYKIYGSGACRVCALDDVSLSVSEGEFLAIVGQSGAGKSTLLSVLGCLDSLTRGTYFLCGKNVSLMGRNELTRVRGSKIGFVFQGYNLINDLTALENVELPLRYRGISPKRRRELAESALCSVGLEHRMHHKPSQMSGGQQQRVAIARAVAAQPPLILADEPTGNLDTSSGRDIMELLYSLNRAGKTVILITHDPSVAAAAPRVLRILDGRVFG